VIDARSVRFGMREFKVAGGKFLLNGKPIFLRGLRRRLHLSEHDLPAREKSEFHRRLSIAREYGFNYVRHHSWTPPEEYLEAADELGMMLQPNFPSPIVGTSPPRRKPNAPLSNSGKPSSG